MVICVVRAVLTEVYVVAAVLDRGIKSTISWAELGLTQSGTVILESWGTN